MKLRSLTTALVLGLASLSFAEAQTIVVGGKNFTEQQILAEMTSQLLEAKGYNVDQRSGMGSTVLRQAQENGEVDIYWEYTGTSLITYNEQESEGLSAKETYDKVKELDEAKGLVWLEPSEANNTYALAMRRDKAQEHGIETLSDLAEAINDGERFIFGSNAEFYARADGLKPLQEAYDFEFARNDVKRMDSGLVYQALRDEQVDVGLVFATDGRIPAFDFVVLEDDKEYFPNYALVPVIRKETLEAHPELEEHLNSISEKLDDETMARLNASVDVDKKTIEEVAKAFLEEEDLI